MRLDLLCEGAAGGAANMERDRELTLRAGRGEIPPSVRFYRWDPPALSIGFHQSAAEFDEEALGRAGVDLVRRPTGGRAILHRHELTYCAALPLALGAPRELFRRVNEALLDGLRAMGIDAELAPRDAGLREARSAPGGLACFSAEAGSEILAGGRKIVGSAQRRLGGAVLQHGSFLLGPGHRDLPRFVRGAAAAAAAAEAIARRTIDAETLLGRPVGFDEAVEAVAGGFRRRFDAPARSAHRPGPPAAAALHH